MHEVLKRAKLPVSALVSLVLFRVVSNAAYVQRGYDAIGGEVFIIPVGFIVSLWAFEKAIRFFFKRSRRKRNRRNWK